MSEHKNVSICGIPYRLIIVDGGAMFSNKSGVSTGRFMFRYNNCLWYLDHSESTWGYVAACHLVQMHELLEKHIGRDHTEAYGNVFELSFKE
jgi:hypothetical protein